MAKTYFVNKTTGVIDYEEDFSVSVQSYTPEEWKTYINGVKSTFNNHDMFYMYIQNGTETVLTSAVQTDVSYSDPSPAQIDAFKLKRSKDYKLKQSNAQFSAQKTNGIVYGGNTYALDQDTMHVLISNSYVTKSLYYVKDKSGVVRELAQVDFDQLFSDFMTEYSRLMEVNLSLEESILNSTTTSEIDNININYS